MEVVVAAYGPAFGAPGMPVFEGAQLLDQGPAVRYATRAKVELDVDGHETLGSVIDRAADKFGVAVPSSWSARTVSEAITGVVFYQPADEEAFWPRPEPWPNAIRLVENGKPSWVIRWNAIRYGELLDARRAGLVEGDVLRPYLWPVIPQADLWPLFGSAAWTAFTYWEHVLAARETWGVGRQLLDRVRGGMQMLSGGHRPRRIDERPDELEAFLASKDPRTSAEAAAFLECTEEAAASLLWSLGYRLREDGSWEVGGDPPAQALRRTVQAIRDQGHAPSAAELETFLPNHGEK